MRLRLRTLCVAVLGGAIVAGALSACGDVHNDIEANATMQAPLTASRSRAPSPRTFSTIAARAANATQPHVSTRGRVMRTAASAADRLAGPYGRAGATVWLVLPATPPRSVVVFGHGWKLTPPSPGHPWVDQFRPWLDHLAAGGSAVIFPNYQLSAGDPPNATPVTDFAAAIRTAYLRLGRPRLPFVAVGYSFGASLAFYYGANASTWGLPVPRAVQAIFPAGMIPGAVLPPLGPSVRVLIQVGDADTQAGSGGAMAFWNWLSSHPAPLKRYEVIHSSPELVATHAAPKSTSPAAQRAFWAPLDRLIVLARRR